ncbi:MAG: 4-diphosphocytidyl-2C-methyl-D-erythritol kinase [Planctomycetota bacterium]|nr:4-diphosphocytidyl-2C-methyl-D-erythritol kinase [Planctomycetota bacterium]
MIVRDLEAGGVEVLAPAKLNLFLEVLGKRPDGYHELETLMVTIGLTDTLEFADDPSGRMTLVCDDPSLPTDSSNLVMKAAERLKAESGTSRGATISLRKLIPAQAGLAGGSSDAAAALVGLDRLWKCHSSKECLENLAGAIGSDVAFFLSPPAAVCRGRGERVEPVGLAKPLHFVLICPPVGVSTADVYRSLIPPERPRPIGAALEALESGDANALGRVLFNRLQPVAEALEPGLIRIREALESLGPAIDGHLMSGSGSAHFGLCRDEGAAGHAARHLERLGLGRVRVVTSGP